MNNLDLENYTIPKFPELYVDVTYTSENEEVVTKRFQNDLPFPLAVSEVKCIPCKSVELLSMKADVKDVIEVNLDLKEENIKFAPGDTVGIIPKNNPKEVEEILCHLGLRDKCDGRCVLSVVESDESDSRKRKKMPPHLPRISTLRELFENCVEIRGPPKKVFLRALAEYASDPPEKGKLLKLCSREGSAEYERVFNASSGDSPGFGLLQFFKSFPSCTPPVSVLLQHLPRLRPRPYSVASSPLEGNCLRIIFSVYKENSSKGVCTSWLESFLPPVDLSEQLSSLSLNPPQSEVPLFFRKSVGFCLPNDLSVPIILIGPGVGVAPYIGFLEHLSALRKVDKSRECGEVWLFYGCRRPDENSIYHKYLKNFADKGVISRLFLSFSQYSGSFDNWNGSRYVQDSICSLGGTFVEQLVDKGAALYISGDGKNMFKDVRNKVAALIETHKGVTTEEASEIIKNLVSKKMYLEDIWI